MNFNDYQVKSRKHAFYPNQNTPDAFRYLIYGITGEAGELAELFKHALRDEGDKINAERRRLIIKELSDILWYLANICTELKIDFNDVPEVGLKKIQDRLKRGTLSGSGNER